MIGRFLYARGRQHASLLICALLVALSLSALSCSQNPPTEEQIVWDENDLPPEEILRSENWNGDLQQIPDRGYLRVLVAHNKTFFFLDKGQPRGITYEAFQRFERHLNRALGNPNPKVQIVYIPVRRDELITALEAGRGDVAAGNLTITPQRLQRVNFTEPLIEDVHEVVVGGPDSEPISDIEDLSGKQVFVRASSSYFESLQDLNQQFRNSRIPEIQIRLVNENLEDSSCLELVQAGIFPYSVVDSHKARFWKKVFPKLRVYDSATVREEGQIAWAVRKESPQIEQSLNAFLEKHRAGTSFGNTVLRRYLRSTRWVTEKKADVAVERHDQMEEYFEKYANKYDLDPLLLTALAYQESRLQTGLRGPKGAVGVMQVKPSTASNYPINIQKVDRLENNIHAGTKFLRYLVDQYFNDEGITPRNRMLFACAAYNAGPNRIARYRRIAESRGLDPNVWFKNVELIAAEKLGRITVQYVSSIYKYYLVYKWAAERSEAEEESIVETKDLLALFPALDSNG
jgi:membrane-bound lytic murein transglycosylase MltF